MNHLLHDLISSAACVRGEATAIVCKGEQLSYADLDRQVAEVAAALAGAGLRKLDRVAIYLTKQVENVLAMFGTAHAGGVFVPVNPVLKAPQVGHILSDAGARILVTTADRLRLLAPVLESCPELALIVLADGKESNVELPAGIRTISWAELLSGDHASIHRVIDIDVAAILYTSGSTGNPKGVVLSHRNMLTGAQSVAKYLENTESDRLLAVLPFSFDVGFSQLSTAFCTVATVVLHDYFLPKDVVSVVEKERVNCITGVPPLWMQIADQKWPESVGKQIRYFANTGGKMPQSLLQRLRGHFPMAKPFLMYGLTEAFRSTYLPPDEVDTRPDSIGKAIPNAEILVVREDGSICDADEPGELVHRGALVSLGYWNDVARTVERFKPVPDGDCRGVHEEVAVWSCDIVKRDKDGFLYFIGRKDGMIKTSGYRVSPTEVEEAVFASGLVSEAAAIGIEDERLGQKIILFATPAQAQNQDAKALRLYMNANLPAFMVPAEIEWREVLPRNPNGKIDRNALEQEMAQLSIERDSD
jgi:acyl-CoA ligase (AMP-forming) (exosortase A-associated)